MRRRIALQNRLQPSPSLKSNPSRLRGWKTSWHAHWCPYAWNTETPNTSRSANSSRKPCCIKC